MTTRLTAADFDQELLILFDAYVHGDMDRRSFRWGCPGRLGRTARSRPRGVRRAVAQINRW